MNLFDKVKCKGFYKKFNDGKWLRLDRKTLTADAMDNNLVSMGNDGTTEKDVEYIEKNYFKHVDNGDGGNVFEYLEIRDITEEEISHMQKRLRMCRRR